MLLVRSLLRDDELEAARALVQGAWSEGNFRDKSARGGGAGANSTHVWVRVGRSFGFGVSLQASTE